MYYPNFSKIHLIRYKIMCSSNNFEWKQGFPFLITSQKVYEPYRTYLVLYVRHLTGHSILKCHRSKVDQAVDPQCRFAKKEESGEGAYHPGWTALLFKSRDFFKYFGIIDPHPYQQSGNSLLARKYMNLGASFKAALGDSAIHSPGLGPRSTHPSSPLLFRVQCRTNGSVPVSQHSNLNSAQVAERKTVRPICLME